MFLEDGENDKIQVENDTSKNSLQKNTQVLLFSIVF
jgi:hypothetical protein